MKLRDLTDIFHRLQARNQQARVDAHMHQKELEQRHQDTDAATKTMNEEFQKTVQRLRAIK